MPQKTDTRSIYVLDTGRLGNLWDACSSPERNTPSQYRWGMAHFLSGMILFDEHAPFSDVYIRNHQGHLLSLISKRSCAGIEIRAAQR